MTLKAARVNKNLTQKEAAPLLGVTVETLRNYENGHSYPNVLTIRKMEEVYGTSYNNLIFT